MKDLHLDRGHWVVVYVISCGNKVPQTTRKKGKKKPARLCKCVIGPTMSEISHKWQFDVWGGSHVERPKQAAGNEKELELTLMGHCWVDLEMEIWDLGFGN